MAAASRVAARAIGCIVATIGHQFGQTSLVRAHEHMKPGRRKAPSGGRCSLTG
jgi:hypothetical protein